VGKDAALEPAWLDMEVRPTDATWEGDLLVPKRSVLIVDRSEETREVLKAALERRGVCTLSAGGARRGLELARQHHPDLIVLDLEVAPERPEEVCAPFADAAEEDNAAIVLLGSCRRNPCGRVSGEFVSKPYHYGPLIRRIEELLDATGRTYARSA
jgi:CheY-like chemotaxis protein